jgi:ABC-type multidrug transport system ATPase subunit
VRGLSFGLECGECFALLGITGAGKTTTFKCLTGEEMPDSGSLKIEGVDFNSIKDLSSYNRRIGFCP